MCWEWRVVPSEKVVWCLVSKLARQKFKMNEFCRILRYQKTVRQKVRRQARLSKHSCVNYRDYSFAHLSNPLFNCCCKCMKEIQQCYILKAEWLQEVHLWQHWFSKCRNDFAITFDVPHDLLHHFCKRKLKVVTINWWKETECFERKICFVPTKAL